MQLALDLALPEREEPGELRKARREVVALPDEALQQRRVVGQAVEDFGGRQPPIGVADQGHNRVQQGVASSAQVRRPTGPAVSSEGAGLLVGRDVGTQDGMGGHGLVHRKLFRLNALALARSECCFAA